MPGAVAFPIAWLYSVDEVEIERLLDSKGITAGREIVVYGDSAAEAATFVTKLETLGIEGARIYEGGAGDWTADAVPAARPPPELRQAGRHRSGSASVLDGGRPEAAPDGPVPAVPRQLRGARGVRRGPHPGRALPRHQLAGGPGRLEPPLARGDRPPRCEGLGITSDTTIVVYGRDTEGEANEKWPGRRAGQIAATRALMILRYAGVDDVRLLDGGYDWWVRAGNPRRDRAARPRPRSPAFGVQVPLRPEVIVDIDEAKEIIADPAGAALVSVRTWREHIGNVSGYNYIGPAGRIKGDVWGNCGTDAYHMQHYRNIDNTMRAYPEIAANWDEAGITPDKWVAFYCGTGWRASETWFYAYLQGWQRIAVYDGGWFEWSQDPINNPIEVGVAGSGRGGDRSLIARASAATAMRLRCGRVVL